MREATHYASGMLGSSDDLRLHRAPLHPRRAALFHAATVTQFVYHGGMKGHLPPLLIASLALLVCSEEGPPATPPGDARVGAVEDAVVADDRSVTAPDGVVPPSADGAALREDAGVDASADVGLPGDPPCGPGITPDRDRVVLIGHRFGPEPGVNGTEISSLTLRHGASLVNDGARLDVGDRPARIAFVPWGRFALVLGEAGTLISVATPSAADLHVIDAVGMPPLGNAELVLSPDGRRAHILRSDVDEDSGVYTVDVACDGTLSIVEDHLSLRLVQGLRFIPGRPHTAVLVGGQAVFEPVDDDDIRLIRWEADGWRQIGAFDVFHDFIDAGAIGVSGDGRVALVPNGAAFSEEGGQLSVLAIDGDRLSEVQRLTGLRDARQARFAPDGVTALLTRFEPGRVTVLHAIEGEVRQIEELVVPLADHVAFVWGGPDEGRAVLPSVHPVNGSQVIVLRVTEPGRVVLEQTLPLGPGPRRIPGPVGVQ